MAIFTTRHPMGRDQNFELHGGSAWALQKYLHHRFAGGQGVFVSFVTGDQLAGHWDSTTVWLNPTSPIVLSSDNTDTGTDEDFQLEAIAAYVEQRGEVVFTNGRLDLSIDA